MEGLFSVLERAEDASAEHEFFFATSHHPTRPAMVVVRGRFLLDLTRETTTNRDDG